MEVYFSHWSKIVESRHRLVNRKMAFIYRDLVLHALSQYSRLFLSILSNKWDLTALHRLVLTYFITNFVLSHGGSNLPLLTWKKVFLTNRLTYWFWLDLSMFWAPSLTPSPFKDACQRHIFWNLSKESSDSPKRGGGGIWLLGTKLVPSYLKRGGTSVKLAFFVRLEFRMLKTKYVF